MKENGTEYRSRCELDLAVLNGFNVASNTGLFVAVLIASIILFGWLNPPLGQILPDGWELMQATSALTVLFIGVALAWSKLRNNKRHTFIGRLPAILCLVVVAVSLFEFWCGQAAFLGPHLASTQQQHLVHPTSIQSSSCFVLLALSLFIDPTRQDRVSYVLDALIMILVMLNLLYIAGYIYQASKLIKVTSAILISPQTLSCIVLLTFVQITRRAPFGSYSILFCKGIAGHTARIVLPFSVAVTYVVILSQVQITSKGSLEIPYVAAITATVSAAIMIIVVTLLAHRIDGLEGRLRNMSVTDELTGAYNLRGLNLHGKQKLLDAKRSRNPLTVLYIDVDGMKDVNDSLGHSVGSELLRDVVTLLHNSFRENDIVSRIGGDEFAVIADSLDNEIVSAVHRLNKAVADINASGNRPYTIGISIGTVSFDPRTNESLEHLIDRADAAMYKIKKERRTVGADSGNAQQVGPSDA